MGQGLEDDLRADARRIADGESQARVPCRHQRFEGVAGLEAALSRTGATLSDKEIPDLGIELARVRNRHLVGGLGVEGDHVARARRGIQIEMRDEAVLAPAVADEVPLSPLLDEEAQTHVDAVLAHGLDQGHRLPHFFERSTRQYPRSDLRLGMAEKEAHVLLHVSERRVEAAVCDRDSGVEIEPALFQLSLRHGVAVRAIAEKVIGRVIEERLAHTERTQDVLVDVGLPRLAGDLLDDAAEVDEAGVRVAVLRAWSELDFGVRHHGHELRPLGGLEGMPVLVTAERPGAGTEARGVREDLPQSDGAHGAEGVVDRLQLGHVLDEWSRRERACLGREAA